MTGRAQPLCAADGITEAPKPPHARSTSQPQGSALIGFQYFGSEYCRSSFNNCSSNQLCAALCLHRSEASSPEMRYFQVAKAVYSSYCLCDMNFRHSQQANFLSLFPKSGNMLSKFSSSHSQSYTKVEADCEEGDLVRVHTPKRGGILLAHPQYRIIYSHGQSKAYPSNPLPE